MASPDDKGSCPPGEGVYGLSLTPEEADVVLIPVPWEATTSYGRGTAQGPEAILAASVQVDLFDVALGDPSARGIAMVPEDATVRGRAERAARLAREVIAAFDAGEPVGADDERLREVDELGAWLDGWLAEQVRSWAERDKLVGVVGGDHSVAFGSIAAQRRRHPRMGILHVDAHADLRVAYQGFTRSHASIMHRVTSELEVDKLVSVGLRDLCAEEHQAITGSQGRVVAFFDAELAKKRHLGVPFADVCRTIADQLPDEVYVSFDIDGLDPVLCPSTGTPVPGGLSFHEACAVLDAVVASGRRIVGFDLCEVAPGASEWDANVGARVLYKLIGYALSGTAA